MPNPSLIAHLQQATSLAPSSAERLLSSAAQGLAAMVHRSAARALLDALALAENIEPLEPGRARLEARVAEALAVDPLRAREYLQITLATLAQHLDPDVLQRVRRDLPDDVAPLLTRAAPVASAPAPHRASGRSVTEARPGSLHPVSEAAAGSAHPVSAAAPAPRQQHSVAEPNPHADTKVSSAHGMTQEREEESLARGKDPKR